MKVLTVQQTEMVPGGGWLEDAWEALKDAFSSAPAPTTGQALACAASSAAATVAAPASTTVGAAASAAALTATCAPTVTYVATGLANAASSAVSDFGTAVRQSLTPPSGGPARVPGRI